MWGHVKVRVAKVTVQTKDEMKAAVSHVRHRLQKLPNIVAGFFRAPTQQHEALLVKILVSCFQEQGLRVLSHQPLASRLLR